MDYTRYEIRPLIYKDKEDIDCFNVDDEKALDAAMLKLIEESPIIELDGAHKYILEIFNTAYYITTLIMMEKRPIFYYRNYLTISEHIGSSSNDISGRNTFFKVFSSFTMAMVCNYLRLLDKKYLFKDNIFIKKVTEHFKQFFEPTSTREDAYTIFTSNLMSHEVLEKYHVIKALFVPRKIDEQAINDAKAHFGRKYSSWSEMITTCGFKSKDYFTKGICRSEEEKTILAAVFRKDQEESDLRAMGVRFVQPFTPDKTIQESKSDESKQREKELQARIKELADENASLKKQLEEERQKNQAIEKQGAGNDEWVVELFSHYCYEDTQVARNIIEEMRDKTDPEIADIIFEQKQQNIISPKTSNIDLWRVLHAARIYESNSYQNLNTALSRRKKRQ